MVLGRQGNDLRGNGRLQHAGGTRLTFAPAVIMEAVEQCNEKLVGVLLGIASQMARVEPHRVEQAKGGKRLGIFGIHFAAGPTTWHAQTRETQVGWMRTTSERPYAQDRTLGGGARQKTGSQEAKAYL